MAHAAALSLIREQSVFIPATGVRAGQGAASHLSQVHEMQWISGRARPLGGVTGP